MNDALQLFDLSQVAEHNDEAHGHWLIIDGFVYDVSELMRIHPGGPRILQLYAGRDASAGFRRVHQDPTRLRLLLARARIGVVRELACTSHASHSAAAAALKAALGLVVEMQNALNADHSFHLSTTAPRSRFELQRGIETHLRFHREYLDVLIDVLSGLASTILTAEVERSWRARFEQVKGSEASKQTRSDATALLHGFDCRPDDELSLSVTCFELLDSWLLRLWKRELSCALRWLEAPHTGHLPLSAAGPIFQLCDRLLDRVSAYIRSEQSLRLNA